MRTWILLIAAALVTGCGKKASPAPAAVPAPSKPGITADIPAGPDAKAFAGKLLKTEVSNFNPTGSSEFTYRSMTFTGDGKWSAGGELELGGESIECKESGTWRIDAMEDGNAIMDWKVTDTNCPSRDSDTVQRVAMGITASAYKISFR